MSHTASDTKQHAHDLIDRLAPGQVSAVVGLLEIMLDPVARSIANAPYEDEPISEAETRAVAASKAWLKNNEPSRTKRSWPSSASRQRISSAWAVLRLNRMAPASNDG